MWLPNWLSFLNQDGLLTIAALGHQMMKPHVSDKLENNKSANEEATSQKMAMDMNLCQYTTEEEPIYCEWTPSSRDRHLD